MSIDEDYFIPVRAGSSSEITSLPGGQYTGDIDDVKYLRDKLFSALKVPQSYLSRGEGAEEDKTTLAQKDIRFARTIQRLQRSVTTELEKIGIIHLYILGYRDDDLLSFTLGLSNPSKLAELQELEYWKTKFDTAGSATEGFFSKRWIAKSMFGMSEEEFLRNQREMFHDRLFEAALETAAEQGADPAAAGAAPSAGGAGPDLGGAGFMGGMEGDMATAEAEGAMETPAGGEEEAPEAEAPEDAGTLLAEPGKRDDKAWRLTQGAKGKWYKPAKRDDRKGSGPRKRAYKGSWSKETATATPRAFNKGHSELMGLGRGIFESLEASYIKEENKIFETNKRVRDLISELKLREKDETKT